MVGSGPVATAGDAAVTLITLPVGNYLKLVIINKGAADGFYSIDGGVSWGQLPGTGSRTIERVFVYSAPLAVLIKRIAGGTDLATVYADAM
jgi:hypothetical protein